MIGTHLLINFVYALDILLGTLNLALTYIFEKAFSSSESKLLLLIFVMLFSLSSLGGGRIDYFRYLVIPLLLFGYCFYPKRFKITLKKGLLILVMSAAMFFLLTNTNHPKGDI